MTLRRPPMRPATIRKRRLGLGARARTLAVTASAVVCLGCASDVVARIDVPGYPACAPGTGGDLRTDEPAALTVTVSVDDAGQEILGFGASDCWTIQHVGQWPAAKREAIADLLFERGLDREGDPRGIGLSLWRFNLGAGSSRQADISRPWRRADTFLNDDFTAYDWSRLPGQRWFLQAARERGVDRFIAFVNSPPINMTKNGRAYPDAASGSTNLADGREADFAAYLADIVEHFRRVENLEFDVLSPFNEPQWDWEAGTQEGCRYSTVDMKRVIEALAEQRGLAGTEIEVPESGSILDLWSGENYLEAFFEPARAGAVGATVARRITSHSYGTDLPASGLVERRKALREALDRYPGLQYSMSEYCPLGPHGRGRDLGMDTALAVARVIHFDLVVAGASSWQWWLAVSPYDYKDGLIYVDHDPEDGEFCESKTLWALGNFSRFVRPGMIRVGVRRSDSATQEETADGLMVSAFLDDDREIVATVLVNWSDRPVPVTVEVEGVRVEGWIPYVTSEACDLGAHAAVEPARTVEIPARSLVTLVGRDSSRSSASSRSSRRVVFEENEMKG
jgi:O-glycosyl hydrolase